MEAEFWHNRWEENQIGWHQPDGNILLTQYFGELDLPVGQCVFIPLCGKSRDIQWLLSHGYKVKGAELSELAITHLFEDLRITPTIREEGNFKHYSGDHIDIYVGDFFDLSAEQIGPIDAVYDRAAYVALPIPMREKYAHHLAELTDHAPQLLITFLYDQSLVNGPPFSIPSQELQDHYADTYEIEKVTAISLLGGIRGQCSSEEIVWHLRPKTGA
ncbi:thiopurine S-methyltransferase [Terasakiella pusilla]|uniref:thiopurine S-methyltransferase n=1 Tax=Terasakiella pusilla TaxID=64973 RepID=UPI003AA8EF70